MTKVKCEWFGCQHNKKSCCQREEIRLKFIEVETKTTKITQGMDESDIDKQENIILDDWLVCDNFIEIVNI